MEGGDRVESGVTVNKQWSEGSALKAHVVQYSPQQCRPAFRRALTEWETNTLHIVGLIPSSFLFSEKM